MGITERKELEKQKMKKLILDTAMRLFLEDGFENITIRHIAKEIEYSPATIYLYFKDKDEILYTLHLEGFEELYRRQQAILPIDDPLKRLRRHGEIYVSFALENPEYYDLMFIMRNFVKNIKEKKEWDVGLRSYEFLSRNIKECMEAGKFPEVDINMATFALWSYVHGMVSLIIRDRSIMLPERDADHIVKEALGFMLDNILDKRMNLDHVKKE